MILIVVQFIHIDIDSGAVKFDPNPQNYDANRPYWLTQRPTAISVEASAYALLAQMEVGDYDYAGRIALWLSNQQNYEGGFVSTQVIHKFGCVPMHKQRYNLFLISSDITSLYSFSCHL